VGVFLSKHSVDVQKEVPVVFEVFWIGLCVWTLDLDWIRLGGFLLFVKFCVVVSYSMGNG